MAPSAPRPNEPGQPALIQPSASFDDWTIDLPTPQVALAIGAHPDDVEFGAGGTLARWAAAGCRIHHLVCTDGSKGTWDVSADTAALVGRRESEQREAARRLAGRPEQMDDAAVTFLRRVDGELDADLATRREVARVIRQLRPDVVLGHDPWKRYRLHPDHRHAGLLVCDGIVAARDPHFFADLGLRAHRPTTLLLFEADQPDHAEDVTDFVDTKIDGLLAHESQFESTMHATDATELGRFADRIRARVAELGQPLGLGAAEVFKRIDDL